MSSSFFLTPALQAYVEGAHPPRHPVLERCRAETAQHPLARMQIAPEQGDFLRFLVQLIDARRIFEVGVFTGYSALNFALTLREEAEIRRARRAIPGAVPDPALPEPGAHVLALDISEELTEPARRYFEDAGVAEWVRLVIGPARTSLEAALHDGARGSYDLGFIDADKTGYDDYLELGLELLRPGGVLLFDNVLWSGRVVDPHDTDEDTVALRELVAKARADARLDISFVTIGDGLLLCRKKPAASI